MEEFKRFSPKERMDNIFDIMTVKVVVQAQDWQQLSEECQTFRRKMGKPKAEIRVGEPLPFMHERALCRLQSCYGKPNQGTKSASQSSSWKPEHSIRYIKSLRPPSITQTAGL